MVSPSVDLHSVRRSELIKRLRKIAKDQAVEYRETEGRSHTKVWLGSRYVTVPRHNEINELTARGILRDAEGD